ncbi:MAG: hypothetical protein IH872_00505 [Chloroflexi bacterium]|nr:hypothetical protein [Chloroflexota bacterium]
MFGIIDVSAIASGLIVATIAGLVLSLVLRWPSITLSTEMIVKAGTDEAVLDFRFENNKWLMSFNADEVHYFLYIPVKFLSKIEDDGTLVATKEFFRITKDGHAEWNPLHNIRDRSRYEIDGDHYFLIRATVGLDMFPKRKTDFLRIAGHFDYVGDDGPRIYYWCSTRHGVVPRLLAFNGPPFIKIHTGKFKDVSAGRLPQAVRTRREMNI